MLFFGVDNQALHSSIYIYIYVNLCYENSQTLAPLQTHTHITVTLNTPNIVVSNYTISIFYWNKFTISFSGGARNLNRGARLNI